MRIRLGHGDVLDTTTRMLRVSSQLHRLFPRRVYSRRWQTEDYRGRQSTATRSIDPGMQGRHSRDKSNKHAAISASDEYPLAWYKTRGHPLYGRSWYGDTVADNAID